MDIPTLLVLFAGGFVAGGVTAVAGGASFLTFPMLIAVGLPPLVANITNWIALMPGNFMALAAYRSELKEMRHEVRAHLVVSFLGGALGCVLLLWTGEARFARAVPCAGFDADQHRIFALLVFLQSSGIFEGMRRNHPVVVIGCGYERSGISRFLHIVQG